jgi:hypothetical protein
MYEGGTVTVTGSGSLPIWVMILQLLNLVLLVGFVFLTCYAGWKVFRWLRKWNP